MGLSVTGAERFLNALTGRAVTAGASMAGKLFTADPPSLSPSNELTGHGYGDHDLVNNDFTIANAGSNAYRRLSFPEMEFFSDAGASAQTAAAFGFVHGTSLIWSGAVNIVPNRARVFMDNTWLQVPYTTSGFTIVQGAMDRGLEAIAGHAYAAADMYWELHSGAANTVPSAANRLTGGGIDGIVDVTWAFSTVNGYRRIRQSELLVFTNALTGGDTNAEPTKLGLWRGRPEDSGVLHAYRTVMPDQQTQEGSSIRISADALYFEINMAGVAPA